MIHLVPIKLTSTNYLLWKHQLDTMLMGFIDGTTPEPTTVGDASATEIATWRLKDKCNLSIMGVSLMEETLPDILCCKLSRATFLALEAVFAHSSISRANQLRAELLSFRRDSLTVDEFSMSWRRLAVRLKIRKRLIGTCVVSGRNFSTLQTLNWHSLLSLLSATLFIRRSSMI